MAVKPASATTPPAPKTEKEKDMPFIPNHLPNCAPRHNFPTTCPEPGCNERVIYIECTCPRPSKFYLHPSGVRHERGRLVADIRAHLHECEGMRERMRQNAEVRDIAKAMIAGYRRVGMSNPDIAKSVEGLDNFTETYKVVMRGMVAEALIKELRNKGENYHSIYVRIQTDPRLSNPFKDAALRTLRSPKKRSPRRGR